MKRYYVTARAYVAPFTKDEGVKKGGEDLAVTVQQKGPEGPVDALSIECIGGRGTDGEANAQIVVKVHKGVKVKVLFL